MKLLHIIDHIGAGGPFRSLLSLVREQQAAGANIDQSAASLATNAYAPLLFEARQLGVDVARGFGGEELRRRVEAADVVLLHFWNTPRMWQFLSRRAPAARYVLWSKVLGINPPQVLGRALLAGMAKVVLTSKHPKVGRLVPDAVVVPGLMDRRRLDGLCPKPHAGFNADYVGTCNVGKLHPGFFRMMDSVNVPGISVRICGQADQRLTEAIETSRDPSRFHPLGFVEDIRPILETSDVFAYPLSETTYATSDKSLQEAMLAGVPPVVFPHGGCASFVTDGKTGLVADSEHSFVAAIEHLHRNPDVRLALGRNARDHALKAFAVEGPAADLTRTLQDAAASAPRDPMDNFGPLASDDDCDAERFLVSQGWSPADAVAAVADWQAGESDALERYAAALPDEAFQVEGGLLHWRNATPENALLRFWCALWLLRKERSRDALAEIDAARRLGAPESFCAALEASAAGQGRRD
jgi:glycosyltransferase involved in cell wall biosynthesis